MRITIEGTITIHDNPIGHRASSFSIDATGSEQWGATTERLSQTMLMLEAMASAIAEELPDE